MESGISIQHGLGRGCTLCHCMGSCVKLLTYMDICGFWWATWAKKRKGIGGQQLSLIHPADFF